MQIKKIVAPTLQEAMAQMKEALGEDAIVLSSKVLEGDPLLGQKKMFEITAGIEDEVPESISTREEPEFELPDLPLMEEPKSAFESELKKLTDKVYRTGRVDSTIGDEPKPKPKMKSKPLIKTDKIKTISRDLQQDVEATLNHRDVDNSITKIVIEQLGKYSAFLNGSNLDNYVTSTIASMIPTSPFEIKKKGSPTVVSLLGPTGVGKTTCIAKLAVISKILHNLDVGLISIDTYRLGALDQLKIFAEVSNIDFLIAYEPSDLAKLVQKFKKKNLIFIDTVGRSQNKPEQLKGIEDFLSAVKVDERYLVLSATANSKNMIDVATKFQALNYDGIVFTKLDEAVTHGNILNLLHRINTPVKYLTNGQVIPDDIIAADSEFIANLVYTGKVIL